MNLVELSIRRPVFAWMLMMGLIVFGALSFRQMGVSQYPDVDFPVVSISVRYDGASPEVMESDIVDVIESAVMTVQGVQQVTSFSRYGSASITVDFDLDRDIDVALQEIQTKLFTVQRNLPRDMEAPVVTKTNPEDQPILWATVTSTKMNTAELMRYVRDQLKDRFTTVEGVGEVILGGYVEPNLRVWVSSQKLSQLDLSVGDVLETIRSEHAELPAGQLESGRRELNVRTLGEARSVAEFENIIVNQRGGRPNFRQIPLKRVARVEEGLGEIRRISRFNGVPALGLGIKKQRGSNAVEVAKKVQERIVEVNRSLPEGMQVGVNFDSTKFIQEAIHELNFNLILSAILTSFVCWLFLGSASSTINVLLAIPTSIVGAFLILNPLGFTLNTFTLLGLSLAVGIVVDDAIMVLENIVRHKELGKSRPRAALEGAQEIRFAALASTVAIAAIFLPVAFMKGVIGVYFYQFGVTITATVLLSLLEALTLTPMRCSQYLVTSEQGHRLYHQVNRGLEKLSEKYGRLLKLCLNWKKTVLVAAAGIFVISLSSYVVLRKEFVPAQDQSVFILRMQTPVDSTLSFTNEKMKEIEDFLSKRPEVEKYFAAVGGFGGEEVNRGHIFVTLKPKGQRGKDPKKNKELTQQEFMQLCREELRSVQDVKVFVQDLSMRGFSSSRGFPVEFTIRGPQWEVLASLSKTVVEELEKTGLLADVDTDYKEGKPEVRIYPDRDKASRWGVSILNISESVRALIGGVIAGKFSSEGRRFDIRVRLDAEERDQASRIKDLYVRNQMGELVRLSDVIKIEEKSSLQQIARFDRERTVSVFANLKTGVSQEKALQEVERVTQKILPEGYRVVLSGTSKTFRESFQGLTFVLLLGILVAYMVLAAQFNSFVHPVSVLAALPFSVSGALLALWLTGQSLNMYSFIGLILLMGIVKKNSILLVEFTNLLRTEEGLSPVEALKKACPIRLRPILMTSFATIAAAVPPALALGPGAESLIPMATAVIGGTVFSTALTLVVVPCLYLLLTRFENQKNFEDALKR